MRVGVTAPALLLLHNALSLNLMRLVHAGTFEPITLRQGVEGLQCSLLLLKLLGATVGGSLTCSGHNLRCRSGVKSYTSETYMADIMIIVGIYINNWDNFCDKNGPALCQLFGVTPIRVMP